MQFYLLAPLIIILLAKAPDKARVAIATSLVAILGVLFWSGVPPEAPYFVMFSGFFIAGIILAQVDWAARNSTVLGGIGVLFIGLLVLLAFPVTRTSIWYEGSANLSPADWANVWWVLAAVLVVPFVSRNVRVRSSQFDRFLGNLAYPLYLFHWIPRQWYYHFSETADHGLVRVFFLAANFIFAFGGGIVILVLFDQPLDRLRTKWVAARERNLGTANLGGLASAPAVQVHRDVS